MVIGWCGYRPTPRSIHCKKSGGWRGGGGDKVVGAASVGFNILHTSRIGKVERESYKEKAIKQNGRRSK
jgi:hypothetical protein